PEPPSSCSSSSTTAPPERRSQNVTRRYREEFNKIRSKKKTGKTFKKGIAEVFEEAGGGLGGMAASILGVDGVIKHCW
ncbi:hypothetical protein ABZ690_20400, partial [Streptomyces sp. NPDC006967]